MPKFKFSLEPLKKYRAHRLLTAKKDLYAIEFQLTELRAKRQQILQDRREAVNQSAPQNGRGMAWAQLHSEMMSGQNIRMDAIDQEMRIVEQDAERHRAWIAQLGKELKAVEKLEEKRRAVFESEEKQRERRKEDAWVVERWSRR